MDKYFVIEDYGYFQDVIFEGNSLEDAQSYLDSSEPLSYRNSFYIVKAVKFIEQKH